MKKQGTDPKLYLILHIMLMVFSLSSVCSKAASTQAFLSTKWILFYGTMIVILGIYAIVWQQIIKRMPLTTAYANKAVAVVWGQIWGLLLFHEKITPGKICGALIIIAGIVLYAKADDDGPAAGSGNAGASGAASGPAAVSRDAGASGPAFGSAAVSRNAGASGAASGPAASSGQAAQGKEARHE